MNSFFLACAMCFFVFTRAQNLNRLKPVDAVSGQNLVGKMVVNTSGDMLVSGIFSGVSDFDPSFATYTLDAGSIVKSYLAKYNTLGKLVWAQPFGVTNDQLAGAMDINTSGEVAFLTSIQNNNVSVECVVHKLNGAGQQLWEKHFQSTNVISAVSITYDPGGNVILNGYFKGTVDFDPGNGTYPLSSTFSDAASFTCKLDSNGDFVWAKVTGPGALCSALRCDANGNIYECGHIYKDVDMYPSSPGAYTLDYLTAQQRAYVTKRAANGSMTWAVNYGNNDTRAYALGTEGVYGDVYIAGVLDNTTDLEPGPGSTSLGGLEQLYVLTLDNTGAYKNAFEIVSTGQSQSVDFFMDSGGNFVLTGVFSGVVDLDPSSATFTLSNTGSNYNAFVARYAAGAQFTYGKQLSAPWVNPASVYTQTNGDVYVGGTFSGTLDPSYPGTITLSSKSNLRSFIVRYGTCTVPSPTASFAGGNQQPCAGDQVQLHVAGGENATYYSDSLFTSVLATGDDYSFSATGSGPGKIYAVSSNTCGENIFPSVFQYTVDACLSIPESEVNTLKVFPNPTNGKFIIESPYEDAATLYLYDASGTLMDSLSIKGRAEVDVSDLAAGIYLAVLSDGNGGQRMVRVVRE